MRNMTKKVISACMAIVMILGIFATAFTAYAQDANTQTDVVIHKIKLNDLNDWPKKVKPNGTYPGVSDDKEYNGSKLTVTDYFGAGAEELSGVKFTYWEVTKELYEKMMATPENYKTKEQVKAEVDKVAEVTNKEGTTSDPTNGENGTSVRLTNGNDTTPKYYWFIEELGSNLTGTHEGNTLSDAKAVPFGLALPVYKADGTTFGTDTNALHVYPKNTITKPKIDKNFGNTANYDNYAIEKAEVSKTIGSNIPYEVKTNLPAKAKYKTLRWEDTMDKGLTYNKDLAVKFTKVNGTIVETDITKTVDYTVTENESGFVLNFTPTGLEKIVQKLDTSDYEVVLTYSATLNSDTVIDTPEENRIKFDYSNNPKTFNEPREKSTTPKEKRITVNKTWADGGNTTAPQNVKVTYFLYEKHNTDEKLDKVVATVTKNAPDYSHTFENLDATKQYYVKELVSGYTPEYVSATDGTVTLKNTKDNENPTPLIPTNPKVITHGKKFVKTNNADANGAIPLLGAEFVVINKNAGENENKYLALKSQAKVQEDKVAYETAQRDYLAAIDTYNKLTAEAQKQPGEKEKVEAAKAKRDEAFNKVRIDYIWTDQENDALKITSNTKGQFEVTGLEAGNYELKETKSPIGYAKLTTNQSFTVGKNSYTAEGNITYEVTGETTTAGATAQQVKNKKITIPQTGGMGTILFTVVGLSIMVAAVISMRREKAEK